MGLGTDGVAGSNNDLDMMEEMDLAAKLQKVTTGDPQALPAEQAFAMATILGARALRMDNADRLDRAGQARGFDHDSHGRAARRADVQRLLAIGVRAEGVGRLRRDGERETHRARPEDADHRRAQRAGEGGRVSAEGRAFLTIGDKIQQ